MLIYVYVIYDTVYVLLVTVIHSTCNECMSYDTRFFKNILLIMINLPLQKKRSDVLVLTCNWSKMNPGLKQKICQLLSSTIKPLNNNKVGTNWMKMKCFIYIPKFNRPKGKLHKSLSPTECTPIVIHVQLCLRSRIGLWVKYYYAVLGIKHYFPSDVGFLNILVESTR